MAHSFDDRLRSYQLVAEAVGLAPLGTEAASSGHR